MSSRARRVEPRPASAPAPGSDLARPAVDLEAFWGWRAAHDGIVREEAREYVRRLASVVGLAADQVVLDFGAGLGFVAEALAPIVASVWWWDPSPAMQAAALRRLAPLPNARLAPASAVTATAAPALRFDLILVNSVVQYMTPRELGAWLGVWRHLLRPAGGIVLSDLVRPGHVLAWDVLDQLALGVRGGCLARTILAGVAEVAPFRGLTRRHPLTRIAPDELRRHAAAAGLEARLLPGNLTHRRRRFAAIVSAGAGRATR